MARAPLAHPVFLEMACDVRARASCLAGDLDAAMASINAHRPGAAPVTLTTMTVTARLNVRRVCRDSMAIALSLVEGDGPLTCTEGSARKRKRPPSEFFNQITLRHGTKSVKVFQNGSMHVTGCTSPAQFLDIASAVCRLMTDVAGVDTEDGSQEVRVVGFDVQMINVNFAVGATVHLQDLCERCASAGYAASYDADTYPGLNVKLPVGDRRVTALVFRSGKVIITGARTPHELVESHRMAIAVLGV